MRTWWRPPKTKGPVTLVGDFVQGNKFRADRNAPRDSYTDHSFERFQRGRGSDSHAREQFFERALLANIFNSSLCADGGGARKDQDGVGGVQSFFQSNYGVILGEDFVGWRSLVLVRFVGQWMRIHDLDIADAGAAIQFVEGKFLGGGDIEQR